MYKLLVRPILFLLDPEKVHDITFSLIRVLNKIGFSSFFKSLYVVEDKRLEREVFGLFDDGIFPARPVNSLAVYP